MNIKLENYIFTSLLLSFWLLSKQVGAMSPEGGCDPNKLTVYRIYLQTAWSREIFPKQYPEWRPPAQWSKLIGRSHDRSYVLFRLNGKASKGMKEFAEGGATDVLEEESQGDGGVFDEFKAPPVTKGVGKSETEFFVDGNHSLVSFASRVVPSPDWFIGIDSFDLCVEGKWIDSVMLELDPLDAGSDNGFTFTSPNWPTVPQKSITRITSQSPNHPANSFFYPDRLEHPPISTVHIMKVKEYELSRVFEPTTPTRAEKAFSYKSPSESPQRTYNEVTPVINELTPPVSNELTPVSNDVLPVKDDSSAAPTYADDISKQNLISSLVKKYKKKFRKNRKGRKMGGRRMRKPRDCRVSDWGEWSPCSKTCGIGEQVRERKVLKHSRRGGRPCPNLKEQKWCGSSRDCGHKYFDW
ncbi:UNVERIFIED_CONTAM: hypothetical protein RMT77_003346 [Armadillidium vulgare]